MFFFFNDIFKSRGTKVEKTTTYNFPKSGKIWEKASTCQSSGTTPPLYHDWLLSGENPLWKSIQPRLTFPLFHLQYIEKFSSSFPWGIKATLLPFSRMHCYAIPLKYQQANWYTTKSSHSVMKEKFPSAPSDYRRDTCLQYHSCRL